LADCFFVFIGVIALFVAENIASVVTALRVQVNYFSAMKDSKSPGRKTVNVIGMLCSAVQHVSFNSTA